MQRMKHLSQNKMIRSNAHRLWALLLIMAAVAACSSEQERLQIFGTYEVSEHMEGGEKVYDTVYQTIPHFEFRNQDNQVIGSKQLKGKLHVADFFFTSCPTICPDMTKQMHRVYKKFEDNDEIALVSFSIDPKRDSVETLKEYADALGVSAKRWHFLTGNRESIYELGQDAYMAPIREDKDAPGGFLHSGAFILVDKLGRIRGYYDGTNEERVNQLMMDITKLLREG